MAFAKQVDHYFFGVQTTPSEVVVPSTGSDAGKHHSRLHPKRVHKKLRTGKQQTVTITTDATKGGLLHEKKKKKDPGMWV